jgi:hypothetical protein
MYRISEYTEFFHNIAAAEAAFIHYVDRQPPGSAIRAHLTDALAGIRKFDLAAAASADRSQIGKQDGFPIISITSKFTEHDSSGPAGFYKVSERSFGIGVQWVYDSFKASLDGYPSHGEVVPSAGAT